MFKFLVIAALLSQKISCQTTDTNPVTLSSIIRSPVKGNNRQPIGDLNGSTFNAAHQTFYVNGSLVLKFPSGSDSNGTAGFKEIRDDYKVVNGIGAYKLHIRQLPWSRARRMCHEEGGHLAIIRSEAEEMAIQGIMRQASLDSAWIGFHDQFEEGEWVSVLDEAMTEVGWDAWAKNVGHVNPDNFQGKQNCAWYVRDSSGIDDDFCSMNHAFICKISIT